MSISDQSLKKVALISFIALIILLIGSIIFYRERALFADIAYTAFIIINDGTFAIINNRYGEVVHQFIPFIFQKLHLPVKATLIGYSLSFNLIYVIVSALLIFRFRQYRFAVLMGIFYFLLVSASAICANDVSFAVALLFLLLGATFHMADRQMNIFLLSVVFALLAFVTVSTHFVIIIPLAFLWSYLIIEKTHWPFSPQRTIGFSVLLIAIIAFKYLSTIGGPQSYDSDRLEGIKKLTFGDMFDSFSTQVVRMFLIRCAQNYWLAPIILVSGIISLVADKKVFLAVWTLLACLGYIVIMGVSYAAAPFDFAPDAIGKAYQLWHIEVEWSCLGIIAATPFVFSILPKLRQEMAAGILAFILLVRTVYMSIYLPDFTWRIDFHNKVMSAMSRKGINSLSLYKDPQLTEKFILTWAIPYETILLSAIHNNKPQLTYFFIDGHDEQTTNDLKQHKGFYNTYGVLPVNMLNNRYFSVDTTQFYKIMSYEELLK